MLEYLDFLEDRSRLLDYTIANESRFVPTTTSTNAANHRRSFVLYDLGEWQEIFKRGIDRHLAQVCYQLDLPTFDLMDGNLEIQLTAHRNDCYYRAHNDNGSEEARSRVLSFVYYFWQEPKGFEGGMLKFERETIAPQNGAIVFFPSRLIHEVTRVSVPFDSFPRSRFTVNGWLRSCEVWQRETHLASKSASLFPHLLYKGT